MGATYTYTCGDCGYSASVSGGRDFGFVVETQTGFCTKCNELVDYVTKIHDGDGHTEKGIVLGACHRCDAPVTQDWSEGDPCPRCGGQFGQPILECDWD